MNPRRVGYRFRPKIDFLIKLLQFLAAGGTDISGCTEYPEDIVYLNMYGPGKEPWKVFSGEHEVNELHDVNKRNMKEKYVVTDLTKLGIKNVRRTAGYGSWDDQSTAKPIELDGHAMGYWRTLTYEYWGDDGGADNKSYYYMNELHLTEYALSMIPAANNDMVICRILKNTAKPCRVRRGKKRPVHYICRVPKKTKKNKKSRGDETLASISCPKFVVPQELGDDKIVNIFPPIHKEYYSKQIDFANPSSFQELQETQGSKPVYIEPGMFSCKPENPVQEQDVANFLSNDFSGSLYAQNKLGVEQNQEQKVAGFLSNDFSGSVCAQNMFGVEENQEQKVATLFVSNNYSDSAYVPDMSGVAENYPEPLQVARFLPDDFSGPVYEPDVFGIAENYQESLQVGNFCPNYDITEMQPGNWALASCSSTLAEQFEFGDDDQILNLDEAWEFMAGDSCETQLSSCMEIA